MWTDITREQHARKGLRLPSDLTDAEWAIFEPLMPIASTTGCQSASKRDPLSACKRGPPGGVALGLITGTDFALGLA